MATRRRLALAIFTASQWHSDSDPGGLAMLSLSSTRKVHTEAHRAALIDAIRQNIQYVTTRHEPDDPKDARRLADLWAIVQTATVGQEWLTDAENLRINEELYQAGKL